MSDQPPLNLAPDGAGAPPLDTERPAWPAPPTGTQQDGCPGDHTGGKTADATREATEAPPPSSPPPPPPERDPFWRYSDLALFLVMAIPSMFAGGLLALWMVKAAVAVFHIHARIPALEPLSEQLGGDAILFAVLALILRLQYDRPLWRSLGWRPAPIPFLWVVSAGLVCAMGVALLGTLIRIPTTTNPIVELMKDRTSAILMAFFGVTIAPLTEELVFRGFLQPLLVRSLGVVPGILLAAVPFGLLHYREYGNSWRHAVLIGLAGAAFGWMRHRTGSTQASTLMHASYNGLIFFAVL